MYSMLQHSTIYWNYWQPWDALEVWRIWEFELTSIIQTHTLFISFYWLPYDRFIASSKARSPHSASSFSFEYPLIYSVAAYVFFLAFTSILSPIVTSVPYYRGINFYVIFVPFNIIWRQFLMNHNVKRGEIPLRPKARKKGLLHSVIL